MQKKTSYFFTALENWLLTIVIHKISVFKNSLHYKNVWEEDAMQMSKKNLILERNYKHSLESQKTVNLFTQLLILHNYLQVSVWISSCIISLVGIYLQCWFSFTANKIVIRDQGEKNFLFKLCCSCRKWFNINELCLLCRVLLSSAIRVVRINFIRSDKIAIDI